MDQSVAAAVTDSLIPARTAGPELDLRELQGELDEIAEEALEVARAGIPLPEAVRNERFPKLADFHQGLRDALLIEIPREMSRWIEHAMTSTAEPRVAELPNRLFALARHHGDCTETSDLQRALSQLLLFEAVRLRLLVAMWSNEDFESLGGEEQDIDTIAWGEVEQLLHEPALQREGVRPLHLMFASASVALAKEASDRAEALRQTTDELRSELRMRAKFRSALRELRLAEAVLLENASATMLGQDRLELATLQQRRPIALQGLSRQAMDQRVSRSRRALIQDDDKPPRRRRPALFDLLRAQH